jgi:Holliday junction resolvasome RuvABC endonuclease subunit
MVVALLGLEAAPAEDASDALAAALCHGHQRRIRARLESREPLVVRR